MCEIYKWSCINKIGELEKLLKKRLNISPLLLSRQEYTSLYLTERYILEKDAKQA